MADWWQFELLKKSVSEWNAWRVAHPTTLIRLDNVNLHGADLREARLSWADLRMADLGGADLRMADLGGADLREARLSWANFGGADLRMANLRGAHLRGASLGGADLRMADLGGAHLTEADLRGASLDGANLRGASLDGAKRGSLPATGLSFTATLSATRGPHSSQSSSSTSSNQSSSSTNWLNLVVPFGSTLFVAAATLASIIQGLDVVERRWREHKEKRKQHPAQTPQSSSVTPSQSPASLSHKTTASDREITEICLVMDDGSHHSFKRWVSDPDTLRTYIDAFNDPMSKVKPLRVVFVKRKGRALSVDITAGGKDNRQLDVILGYLDADPQA